MFLTGDNRGRSALSAKNSQNILYLNKQDKVTQFHDFKNAQRHCFLKFIESNN